MVVLLTIGTVLLGLAALAWICDRVDVPDPSYEEMRLAVPARRWEDEAA